MFTLLFSQRKTKGNTTRIMLKSGSYFAKNITKLSHRYVNKNRNKYLT